jgi:hypothetical protein
LKTKNWYERHKPKIPIVGAVTLAVGLAVVAHQRVQGTDGQRPGYTLVRRWFYLSPDDDDPGEAAAERLGKGSAACRSAERPDITRSSSLRCSWVGSGHSAAD